MGQTNTSERLLIILFLGILLSVPFLQGVVELRRGDRLQALDIFRERPSSANLRRYERGLEDESVVARASRPLAQYGRFAWFKDGGEKAVLGEDGWLFYGPGLDYFTQKRLPAKGQTTAADALRAIINFREQLAARGIELLVVPAPNKESIYPEKLSRRGSLPPGMLSDETRQLVSGLQRAGVQVLDLFELFAGTRLRSDSINLYLAQDSHWSPAGLKLAAEAVAQRLIDRNWVRAGSVHFDIRKRTVNRAGDIVHMLRVPRLERDAVRPILCEQVVRADTHELYQDQADSEVLVLGDSFLRIFQQDDPGSAGFVAHLARALGQPVSSIINDGGASTLVRQELNRRPKLLLKKKVVVWEFVERDIRLGTEGWQKVPLPESVPSEAAKSAAGK